jgi:hypothetical protein
LFDFKLLPIHVLGCTYTLQHMDIVSEIV